MADKEEILIQFTGKGAENIQKMFKGITGSVGGLQSALSSVTKIAAGFVLGTAITKAPAFFMDAAKAAAEDAASMERLNKAVLNTGYAFEDYGNVFDEVIAQGQKLAFTDDQTRDSLALLVAQTGDIEEATKRYALAQDLARGANIDVVAASKLLGKVTEDNVNVLARYGIAAHEGMTETELFGLVQKKFGGQAETFAKSVPGMFARLKDAFGEMKEQIGYTLLPLLILLTNFFLNTVLPTIQKVADLISIEFAGAFKTVTEFVQNRAIPAIEEFISKLSPGLLQAAKDVKAELPEVLKTFAEGLKAVAVPLGSFAESIAALATDINVLGSLATISGLLYVLPNLWLVLAAAVIAVVGAIGLLTRDKAELSGTLLEIRERLDEFLASPAGVKLQEFLIGLRDQFNLLAETIKTQIIPAVQEFATKFVDEMLPKIIEFGKKVYESIIVPLTELAVSVIMGNLVPVLAVLAIGFFQLAQQIFPRFIEGVEVISVALFKLTKFLADNKILMVVFFAAIAFAIASAIGPGTLAIIAIVALITLVGRLSEVIGETVALFKSAWESLPAPVQAAMSFIAEHIKTKIEGIIEYFKGMANVFIDIVQLISALVHGDWSRAWNELKDIVMHTIDIWVGFLKFQFGALPELILSVLGAVVDAGSRLATDLVDAILNALESLPSKMAGVGKKAANAFLDSVSVAGVSAGDVAGFIGKVTPWAVGTPFVPNDMLAIVHKGEAIIPANNNPFAGKGNLGSNMEINIGQVIATDEAEARNAAGNLAWLIQGGLESRGVR